MARSGSASYWPGVPHLVVRTESTAALGPHPSGGEADLGDGDDEGQRSAGAEGEVAGGRFARARQNGLMLGGGSAYVNWRVAWPQPAGASPSLTAVITWMRSSGVGLATP